MDIQIDDFPNSLHDYSFGLDDAGSSFAKFNRISRDEKPSLKITEGRHPIVIATNSDMAFIPNNFELDDRLAILTGANMGNELNFALFLQLTHFLSSFFCEFHFFLFPFHPEMNC